MELKISSDPRWLRLVRAMMQEISRQAGFTETERHGIVLAVDEALSNIMKHAYRGDPNGDICLMCQLHDASLEIELHDHGETPDPKRLEPPPPDDMRPGHRGVFLMRSTMDEVKFERNGDTNLVRLLKHVKERTH